MAITLLRESYGGIGMKQTYLVLGLILVLAFGATVPAQFKPFSFRGESLPNYDVLKHQLDSLQSSGLPAYKDYVRSCRKVYRDLDAAVFSQRANSVLKQQVYTLQQCRSAIDLARGKIGDVLIDVHRVYNVGQKATGFGWTPDQIEDGRQWYKRAAEIFHDIASVQNDNLWFDQVDGLLERATKLQQSRLVFYTSPRFYFV
jgi:hypothetical protein